MNEAREARGLLGFPPWVVALGLFVIAFAIRAAAARRFSAEPVWDGHYYDFGARRIAQGFGYSDDLDLGGRSVWHPWCHYPVGYSGFLGFFYWLFGASRTTADLVNTTVGALLAPATFGLARKALGRTRATIAGLLVTVHPGLVLYSVLVMSEQLSALVTLVAFVIAIEVTGKRGLVVSALVLGAGALVRPQALLCAPFLACVAAWPALSAEARARRGFLRKVRALAPSVVVACALALVPVLPWTARNCAVMDGCALVSTNGGWNLAIGSFPRATGRFETLRATDGCREVTGQVQQDRCWFAYGVAAIRASPVRWLVLVPKKLSYTFDHESFAVEYLHEARPDEWPEARRAFARDLLANVHRCLVVAAAFGTVFASRRRSSVAVAGAAVALAVVALRAEPPAFWPLALLAGTLPFVAFRSRPLAPPAILLSATLVLTTALTHAVFFGEDRYHVVVTPALCLLAAAAFRRRPLSALATKA